MLYNTDVRTLSIIDSDQIIKILQYLEIVLSYGLNWIDSKQYYWNWVDDVVDEVIEWNSNNIAWVASDETKNYVITSNYRIEIVM